MKKMLVLIPLILLCACRSSEIVNVYLKNLSAQCETLYARVPLNERVLEVTVEGKRESAGYYFVYEDGSGTNVTMTYGCKGATPTEFTITRNIPGIDRTEWRIQVDEGSVTPTVSFGGDVPTGP